MIKSINLYAAEAGGYFKNFSYMIYPQKDFSGFPDRPLGSVKNRMRINFLHATNIVDFSLQADLYSLIQDEFLYENTATITDTDIFEYRISDPDKRLYPGDKDDLRSFALYYNLDRLNISFDAGFSDIILGRQAIAWGAARVVNPTDLFAPYTFSDIDTEDRAGVDALRIRIPTGLFSEIDCGYVCGKGCLFEDSAVYLRSRLYYKNTDITPLAVAFRENLLLGLNMAGAIGRAGVWMETGYVLSDVFKDTDSSSDYFRMTVGGDYNISSGLYGFIEYHYSGPGENDPEDYIKNVSNTSFQQGGVYLMAKHYLIPGINYQLAPLVTLTAQAMINLSDISLFITPSVEYNIAPNVYLSGGFFRGIGESPGNRGKMNSEFGSYPQIYYLSTGIYF